MHSVERSLENFINTHPIVSFEEAMRHPMSDPHCQDELWRTVNYNEDNFPLNKNLIHLLFYVRNLNKELFNAAEGTPGCVQKIWSSQNLQSDKKLDGGGAMNVMRAQHLEKSAVNMSIVQGPKYPAMEGEYAGKPFAAAGVSLISHPRNPNAPIMHLNVRSIVVNDNGKKSQWIGGGADLTPMMLFEEDTQLFHEHMRLACEKNPRVGDYERYQKWADEYFFIPHRHEIRGVGGIFFDFIPLEQEQDFSFLLDVVQYATHAYAKILSRRIPMPYDDSLHEKHLYWRGRYAEFNLVYDRGTRFGLLTGGNPEAILCSMPPQVRW